MMQDASYLKSSIILIIVLLLEYMILTEGVEVQRENWERI